MKGDPENEPVKVSLRPSQLQPPRKSRDGNRPKRVRETNVSCQGFDQTGALLLSREKEKISLSALVHLDESDSHCTGCNSRVGLFPNMSFYEANNVPLSAPYTSLKTMTSMSDLCMNVHFN